MIATNTSSNLEARVLRLERELAEIRRRVTSRMQPSTSGVLYVDKQAAAAAFKAMREELGIDPADEPMSVQEQRDSIRANGVGENAFSRMIVEMRDGGMGE